MSGDDDLDMVMFALIGVASLISLLLSIILIFWAIT